MHCGYLEKMLLPKVFVNGLKMSQKQSVNVKIPSLVQPSQFSVLNVCWCKSFYWLINIIHIVCFIMALYSHPQEARFTKRSEYSGTLQHRRKIAGRIVGSQSNGQKWIGSGEFDQLSTSIKFNIDCHFDFSWFNCWCAIGCSNRVPLAGKWSSTRIHPTMTITITLYTLRYRVMCCRNFKPIWIHWIVSSIRFR